MGPRRCTLCGQKTKSGAGNAAFVCEACLAPDGRELLEVMRGSGFVSEEDVKAFLSQQSRVPMIDLADHEIPEAVRRIVPRELCERHLVVPVLRAGRSLVVAVTDPGDTAVLEAIATVTAMTIEPVIASAEEIRAALSNARTRL